jgi:hypothetical protein
MNKGFFFFVSEELHTGNPSRLTVIIALSGGVIFPIVLIRANAIIGDQINIIIIKISGKPIMY